MNQAESSYQSPDKTSRPSEVPEYTSTFPKEEKQIRAVEVELVRAVVEDIRSLWELAGHTSLDTDDARDRLAGQHGAVGLAIHMGRFDVVQGELAVWAPYFATHIDELFTVFEVIEAHSTMVDERALVAAYAMAQEILGALNGSIQSRLAKVSA